MKSRRRMPKPKRLSASRSNSKSDSPATLNYLGYMFADRGIKLDEALTMIQKAVDSDPISGAYLDSLGWVYYKMNRLTEAEQYLKKAVRFASTDSTMHDHLGDLYNKIMKYPEAASEWQKAIQLANEPREADPDQEEARPDQEQDSQESPLNLSAPDGCP